MKAFTLYSTVIILIILPVLTGCKESSTVMPAPPSEAPEELRIPSAFTEETLKPVSVDESPVTITTDGAITIEETDTPSNDTAADTGNSSAYFHKCRQGDTIKGIAEQYGYNPAALASLNGITASSSLKPGHVLVLPRDFSAINLSSEVTTYTVASGDTYSRIARHFKMSPSALMKMNNAKDSSLRIGDVLYAPKP